MKSFRPLYSYVRRYRWRFAWGILFVLLANVLGVQVPKVVGDGINVVVAHASRMTDLGWVGIYIVVLAGLAGAFRYLMRRVLIDTSRDMEYDFRNDIYRHLQRLDSSFYDGHSTGDVMARMTNDIDIVRMMIGPAIMYTANTIFTLPLVLGYMLKLDWRTTLAGLAPMILLPPVVKMFGNRMHKVSRAQQDQMAELTTFVQESLAGMRVIKAYGQEVHTSERFGVENGNYIDKSLQLARIQASFFPAIRLVTGLGMLMILYIGARRIIAEAMDYGTLVSLVMMFGMLIWPLIAAGWVINLYQRGAASMDRINEMLSTEPLVKNSDRAQTFTMPDRLDIEFRDVTFTYQGATFPALRNVTMTIPEGRTLGIIGRVGAGKSTFVHLLLRLYPVDAGQIYIGGIDINDWPLEELRRAVGIVFQETFLFSETIADNVRFGALGELTDEDIVTATTKADVHKDIAEFPKQYETMLGERGINLSGGQKQRLSLARALVRDARVMILDDSLSAVDTHTEEAILSSLKNVMQGRTTLLISHRISTVALADEIIVFEDGAITQRGAHDALTAQPGLYADLYRKQLLEEEVEALEVS